MTVMIVVCVEPVSFRFDLEQNRVPMGINNSNHGIDNNIRNVVVAIIVEVTVLDLLETFPIFSALVLAIHRARNSHMIFLCSFFRLYLGK